jgi:hypothetical protein
MKNFTRTNKLLKKPTSILLLLTVFCLTSCLPKGVEKADESDLDFSTNNNSGPETSSPSPRTGSDLPDDGPIVSGASELSTKTEILNFNQMSMNFSKITGVDRGHPMIKDVMSEVLSQLPSSNNVNSFTAFTQVSITRLSFSYCDVFVDEDSDFSSINYSASNNEEIINLLLTKTLDTADSSNPSVLYEDLASELNDVLNNNTNDPEVTTYIDSSIDSIGDRKKRLTKMACTLTLSSSYVTMF